MGIVVYRWASLPSRWIGEKIIKMQNTNSAFGWAEMWENKMGIEKIDNRLINMIPYLVEYSGRRGKKSEKWLYFIRTIISNLSKMLVNKREKSYIDDLAILFLYFIILQIH